MERKFLILCTAALFFVFLKPCIGLSFHVRDDPPVPTLPAVYNTTGTIRLPYAEIVEPFTAYFDGKNRKSRVDYYNGIQKVINIASSPHHPYGMLMKIIPFSDQKVLNKISCFAAVGDEEAPVEATSILPDLTGFKFSGSGTIRGTLCNLFQKVVMNGKKKSTYTFAAQVGTGKPIQYEMMGYDSLLGSHYDKYYVDYLSFNVQDTIEDVTFLPPNDLKCTEFPGPGLSSAHPAHPREPLKEFLHGEESHMHMEWKDFIVTHRQGKEEASEARLHIFRQNLRFISSKNREGLSFSLAVNHLADHTKAERKAMRGYRWSPRSGGADFPRVELLQKAAPPEQWDWRLQGAVTPVKDQAICGSCWSFGTTGTIEGANFLKTGQLVRLSQQELVDCAWGYQNNGCDGGEDFRAYHFIMANGGLSSEELYGDYKGIDRFCLKNKVKPVVQVSNFTLVPPGDEDALRLAIFHNGPISVAIDASHPAFSFYSNGVYYEPKCSSDPDGLDHAVLAVGYGSLGGQAYWLVKNSWSTHWGNDGYVLMSAKDNNCGVATAPSFVTIK